MTSIKALQNCERKKPYLTRAEADYFAIKYKKKHGTLFQLYSYFCWICRSYHLTKRVVR